MRKKGLMIALGCMALMCAACTTGKENAEDAEQRTNIEKTENENKTENAENTGSKENMSNGESNMENKELIVDTTNEVPEVTQNVSAEKSAVAETDCPKEVYEAREGVEYGSVIHFTYFSETTGLERGANILLPAGYSTEKKYPVLYFQHGIFGDEYSMINDLNNHIKEIVGNLALDGKADEIIVVFGNMYAASDPDMKPGFSAEEVAPYDNFINDLINDLMPYVEENYSVLTGRENTAVIGFSMGGRETLYIGLMRPDLFSCIGAISPAPGLVPAKDWAMTHPGQLKEEEVKITDTDNIPELLMICCGTKDSVVGTFPKSYHELMEKNGVEHLWYEVPRADHDNRAIRSGLYNFVTRWMESRK